MEKAYELGILVGRFQTFHKGHQDMIGKAVALCGTVGVFIGSSQEVGTAYNPFSYETRARLLRKIYGEEIGVFPLPDLGVGNNAQWGDYVLQNVIAHFGRQPDLLVSGKETRRLEWFDSVHGLAIAELYVPKTIDISATQMRDWLAAGDAASWRQYTDERLWDEFDALRAAVLSSQDNARTESL